MTGIDFRIKINWQRRYRPYQGPKDEHEILRIFESDRGRIINSAAIRRLQQKTQVFPLERNAAVRTRLTHSLEVQQVGRYIAKEVLTRLQEAARLVSPDRMAQCGLRNTKLSGSTRETFFPGDSNKRHIIIQIIA